MQIAKIDPRAELLPLDPNDDIVVELTSAQLVTEQTPISWLLPGMLQQHEPAVIVGPTKSLKTSLAVDLCGALATGGKFLGQFAVDRPFRVGFVGGGTARNVLTDLAQRWSAAAEVDLLSLDNLVWRLSSADLSVPANLQRLEDWIVRHQLEVVMIDIADLSTKSRRAQATQLRALIACCLKVGVTPIVCCPTGFDFKPRQLRAADLTSAACHGLARQWLLVNRRQEYAPGTGQHPLWLTLGGDTVPGGVWGVDVDEGGDLSDRKWEVTLRSVESIAQENAELEAKSQAQRWQAKIRVAMTGLDPTIATKLKIRQLSHLSGDKFGVTWDQMVRSGEIIDGPPLHPTAPQYERYYQLAQPAPKKNDRSPVHSNAGATFESARKPLNEKQTESSPLPEPDLPIQVFDMDTLLEMYGNKPPQEKNESSPVHSPRKVRRRRVKPRKRSRK